jgi:hypothetical protein
MNESIRERSAKLLMSVHLVQRARELARTPGVLVTSDLESFYRAAETQLSSMTGLELVDALLEYRRVTGRPVKI